MAWAAEEYVFVFGSLVAGPLAGPMTTLPLTREPRRNGYVLDLAGFRRDWGVAMDNSVDLPGYKYFVHAEAEDAVAVRPAVCVAFLDIVEDANTAVNGVIRKIDSTLLGELDRRERNYTRIEVTERVADPPGKVWAYAGLPESRQRREAAATAGRLVVQQAYLEAVERAFGALGPGELEAFRASTSAPGCPALHLERVDLA